VTLGEIWAATEKLAARAISAIGVLYVIGFAVSAVAFAQYSLASFDLLKAQYVLAGFWAVVPFAVIVPLPRVIRFAHRYWDERISPIKNHARGLPFMLGFVYAGVVTLLLQLVLGRAPEKLFARQGTGTDFILFLGFFLLVIATLRLAMFAWSRLRPEETLDRGAAAGVLILLSFAIGFYIVGFSILLYSRLPAAIGGGAPSAAVVIFRRPITLTAADLAVSNAISVRCLIVSENDRALVVLVNDRIVQIPRDTVDAIVLNDRPRKRSIIEQLSTN
jgi:hypothetical protein